MKALSVVALFVLVGCGGPMAARCETGRTVSCACDDGATGAQTCLASGAFSPCACRAETRPTARRVFITRDVFTADFGGVDGADAICTAAARAVGLDGAWHAWLSSDAAPALLRVGDGPWNLLTGTRVFDDRAGLKNAALHAIDVDETRHSQTGEVWTGTETGGAPAKAGTCGSWASTRNDAYAAVGTVSAHDWTYVSYRPCTGANHFYCFED